MTFLGIGPRVAFAGEDPLPLEGFPPGRIRIRQRAESIVMAFVKTDAGISQYVVLSDGGKWKCGPLVSRNQTVQTK